MMVKMTPMKMIALLEDYLVNGDDMQDCRREQRTEGDSQG